MGWETIAGRSPRNVFLAVGFRAALRAFVDTNAHRPSPGRHVVGTVKRWMEDGIVSDGAEADRAVAAIGFLRIPVRP